MDRINIGHHISKQFNDELEDIRNKVLAMGGIVEQQLNDALSAVGSGDGRLGEVVITNDYKVNALEVAIDEECTHVLARRQPTASDLRLIVAIIKTITDLERMGDEAERIGRKADLFLVLEWPKFNYAEIGHMGDLVRQRLHNALDAVARVDAEAAVRVAREDMWIDREYEATMRQLSTFMLEDPRSITRVLDVIWTARALERIGDHARNICEYVIYLVRGKDVRHTSYEQMEQEVRDYHNNNMATKTS